MKSRLRNHLWVSRMVFAGGQLPGGMGAPTRSFMCLLTARSNLWVR